MAGVGVSSCRLSLPRRTDERSWRSMCTVPVFDADRTLTSEDSRRPYVIGRPGMSRTSQVHSARSVMVVIAAMYEAIGAQLLACFDGSRAQALIPKRIRPHRPAGWAMPSSTTWVGRVPEFGGEEEEH